VKTRDRGRAHPCKRKGSFRVAFDYGRQLTYYMLLFGLIFCLLTYKMEYVRHRSLYIDKQDKKKQHIFIFRDYIVFRHNMLERRCLDILMTSIRLKQRRFNVGLASSAGLDKATNENVFVGKEISRDFND